MYFRFAFPDDQDFPAVILEELPCCGIARDVARELGQPVGGVGRG